MSTLLDDYCAMPKFMRSVRVRVRYGAWSLVAALTRNISKPWTENFVIISETAAFHSYAKLLCMFCWICAITAIMCWAGMILNLQFVYVLLHLMVTDCSFLSIIWNYCSWLNRCMLSCGVVEGVRGVTPFPQTFCWRNAVPPPTIRTSGNADTVALGLQRNEKSRK